MGIYILYRSLWSKFLLYVLNTDLNRFAHSTGACHTIGSPTWCSTDVATRLQDAINSGNEKDAGIFAEALARTKADVNIRDVTGLESELRLNVTLENSDHHLKLVFTELPQVSVRALKLKIRQTYQFEPANQKWVINGKFACETDRLVDFVNETQQNDGILECHVYIMHTGRMKAF
ncbi:hypothetical protein HELRODRAFT_178138 [Helobdella robusta]|uniref:Ubiquitin-like domain-containing protein n=1 Tax=Helobdella robusta TaxID=6412 RepID=T1FCT7_HELRO|nr:hypothetical protein HELRODRAFT_178138 [Helobdella robusta]ESN97353.1 hypothetical protein HELRODRAFT_178138 [Helobdella robusta]